MADLRPTNHDWIYAVFDGINVTYPIFGEGCLSSF